MIHDGARLGKHVYNGSMILEGLITSLNDDGSPHLAPMGPEMADEQFREFALKPFKTSHTFQNLKRNGEGVLHVTDDVLLLARAAVGSLTELPPLMEAHAVKGFILKDACRAFEFRVREIDERSDRVRMQCGVQREETLRPFFGFNRAKHAVLEAAILATRFHLKDAAEIDMEFARLRIIVNKTAGPRELEAMAFLEAEWARKR